MPETLFQVRWPDAAETLCYSPSRAIAEFLEPSTEYPIGEFVARSRAGLLKASERVQSIYGMPCSRAAAQIAAIERIAERFAAQPDATVRVQSMAGPG